MLGARLGLLPWERRRLTPVELERLYEGQRWRRSRDMEALWIAVRLIRGAWLKDDDPDAFLGLWAAVGYDMERPRRIARAEEQMREQALAKMRTRKRA